MEVLYIDLFNMSLIFPIAFWQSTDSNLKFSLTNCDEPDFSLYTESDLSAYTGTIVKFEDACFFVVELEEFPEEVEVIPIDSVEGPFEAIEGPEPCDCCKNGDTYEITDCEGVVVGVVDLTDLDVAKEDVIKVEENENCFIVGEKVCTEADLVFFQKLECLVAPEECCQNCGDEPPVENYTYTVCGTEEVAIISEIQLHTETAQSIWYNCQWYGIGETTPLPATEPIPLPEQVFSSELPCEEAQELQQTLQWVKCGTEEEFIYTNCCELPDGSVYTPGLTTTNNFILEEPSADCYTFVSPAQLPEGVDEVGCPEFVVLYNCEEEPCFEEPPVETPKFTIDGESQDGSSDFESAAPELPPPFINGTEGQVWSAFQYSEEGEELVFLEVFTTGGFIVGDPQYIVINEEGQINFPAFGLINFELLEPGKVYQINFVSDTTINSAAYESTAGLITFYE